MKTFLLFAFIFCTITTTKATNYYFSSVSGDDSRTTSEAQHSSTPWKTLGKLNSFFNNFVAGDSILLRRDETFYGLITVNGSGTATNPIVIGAYGTGADPIVTSLVSLTWTSVNNNLWISNESLKVDSLNMLTVNDAPVTMGRWPNLDNGNGGYDSIRSLTSKSITDKVGLTTSPSAGKPAYFIGAEIVIRTTRWSLDRHPITNYNSGTSTITYDPSSTNEVPDINKGYFIQNDSTVLDKKNEWWYNRDNGKVKIYSEESPVNVNAANAENLLISSGERYITVDNITFNGSNADAISISGGSNVIIQNCTIQNIGRNGIKVVTPYCSFLNNKILNVMSKGIVINSQGDHTVIRYNSVKNISQVLGLGTSQQEDNLNSYSGDGVYIKADAVTIEHNMFIKMGYAAVHLTKVDSAIIRYNYIDTVCNVFDDGGAIYSYTGTAYANYGREISHNIILHGIGAIYGSGVNGNSAAGAGVAGIYDDRGTSGIDEEYNTVAYFEKGIFENYGCNRNKILHNTFYNNVNGIQINTRSDDKTRNLTITDNIAFAAIPSQTTMNIYSDDGDDLDKFGSIDANYYARPIKDNITMSWQADAGSNTHYVSLTGWQKEYSTYDDSSKQAPVAITKISQLKFEYNATDEDKTIPLNDNYIDSRGNAYSNSITLQPFTSVILINTNDSTTGSVQNVPPTVSITSPADSTNFTAPASINISANAADADGSIATVEFYNGNVLVNTQSTFPYSFTWKNVATGNYVITAQATDDSGMVTISAPVNIFVTNANAAPTVAITSPSNNASFTAPASIDITASANDSDGSVARVDFYNGNTLLGSDSTSPYAFTWNNVAAGNYLLTAKVTDNDDSVTSSDSVTISVITNNSAPTVTITSPSANANFTAPASINISANAADADGSVATVDFYSGDTLLATQNTSPYTFTWNNVAAGNYVLTARATDNAGLVTSDSVKVTVTNSNGAPTVTITSPLANANFTAPASINISANAADADGSVAKVDFYNGNTLLASDSTSAYSFTWNNVTPGNYVLTAKVTDNKGMVTSDSVNISVTANAAPTVAITSPSASDDFTAPASINISATAADADGSIVKVDFYHDSTLLGTQNTSPYSFTWNNVPAGNYVLTAKATDDGGLVSFDTVAISVSNINGAPTVSITSPSAKGAFTAPTAININAIAADADGSIIKVDFYKDNTLLGSDSTSPYAFTMNNVAAGNYVLTAKATDNAGMVTLSDSVNISVARSGAPTIIITSPLPNAGFIAPASITIRASAADSDGSVTRVDFYNGNTLIGTDNSSPYSFLWKNVATGNYVLTAKAIDNKGLITSSAAITVYIVKPNVAPSVSITSPITNIGFTTPASVNISATASDIDGSIAKVEFFNGATLFRTQYAFPYYFTWKDVPAGKYTLTAKATDNNGRVTLSAPVVISIFKPNVAPKVSITSPKANTAFVSPASINITTSASDADGSVTKVDFYNGNTLIGSDNSSPYSFTWKNAAAGNYALTAKATDNKGLVTSSAAVTVIIRANKAPAVSLTSPLAKASFNAPASIIINASASDADGSVAKVEFFNGSTLLNSDNASPYSYTWKNVPSGNYTLTAKVTDNNGLVTTSSAVAVSVKPNVAPTVSITSPSANTKFNAPASVNIVTAASDADGSVAKVDFYNGNTLIGTDNTSPYSFTWKNVAAGNYSLIAKATDNGGLITSSAAVKISVLTPGKAKTSGAGNDDLALVKDGSENISDGHLNNVSIKVGPNPASNILSVFTNGLLKNKDVNISVLSITGTLVKTAITTSGNEIIQVNVSSLTAGFYILKIVAKDVLIYKQFEKQ